MILEGSSYLKKVAYAIFRFVFASPKNRPPSFVNTRELRLTPISYFDRGHCRSLQDALLISSAPIPRAFLCHSSKGVTALGRFRRIQNNFLHVKFPTVLRQFGNGPAS